jgi:hypothetical protein
MLMLIIFGCNIDSYGQMTDSVLKYYHFKNVAELAILDSNYREANENYKLAFQYKKPNLLDVCNAFFVAYEVEDSNQCQSTFTDLVLHGVRGNFLNLAYIKSVREQPRFINIYSRYDSLTALENKIVNWDYIKLLNSLYHYDQDYREQHKSPDSIVARDLNNINEIKNAMAKYGYPCYENVGMYEDSYEGWPQYFSTTWLILLHTRHLSQDLNKLLLQALNSGQMAPDDYAAIIDMQEKEQKYHTFLKKKINTDSTVSLVLPENYQIVDERRRKIGLADLALHKRKLEFTKRDSRFYFFQAYLTILANSKVEISQF